MTALTRCAGLLTGLSAVAVIGVAVAQSEPPNPVVTNPAIGAGQQSTHMTPMGETGVLAPADEPRAAALMREPEVAAAPAPAPAAEPAPPPVAAAPAEPAPSAGVMGAAPEPAAEPAPMRQDRN